MHFSILFSLCTSIAALTIDNQLQVIRNDCYERLAIGHRLKPKDVYKKSEDNNTVKSCQMLCTEEKDICKSFSFGIGKKGNATCELSNDPVKESADLKPIGTIQDTDYDLYIKKLGCTLVITPKPDPVHKPTNAKPASIAYGLEKPDKPLDKPDNYLSRPNRPQDSYDRPLDKPNNHLDRPERPHDPYKRPEDHLLRPDRPLNDPYSNRPHGGPDKPYRPSDKPDNGLQHVQTLVSVSTGPKKPLLHPILDILVQDYEKPARKPIKPPIPDKYGSYLPKPEDYYKPRPNDYYFENKPLYDRPQLDDRPFLDYNRPHGFDIHHKPSPDSGYNDRPDRPKPLFTYDYYSGYGDTNFGYWDRYSPSFGYDYDYFSGYEDRPSYYDDNHFNRPPNQRPVIEYGLRPSGDGYSYNKPQNTFSEVRPGRPDSPYNRPQTLDSGYNRPQRPHSDYNRPSYYDRPDKDRPQNPSLIYYDIPQRPVHGNRPMRPSTGYEDRPHEFDRPEKPSYGYEDRPSRPNNGYEDRPERPTSVYGDRPQDPLHGHDDRPQKPLNGYEDRPQKPLNGYDDRPQKPSNEYDHKPLKPIIDYEERPQRPTSVYEDRPQNHYNEDIPQKPSNGYEDKPQRPNIGYERPWRPTPHYEDKPQSPFNGYEDRPQKPTNVYEDKPPRPNPGYEDRPDTSYQNRPQQPTSGYADRPQKPPSYEDKPQRPTSGYQDKPQRPTYENKPQNPTSVYEDRPQRPDNIYEVKPQDSPYSDRPNPPSIYTNKPGIRPNNNEIAYKEKPSKNPDYLHQDVDRNDKPVNAIITQTQDANGGTITAIITPLDDACFRRVLAGKRVARGFVKRGLYCESIQDCQQECAEERRFSCEGFNYRLDQSGRGRGECELLSIPLSHLDTGRDVYPDPDYDYYERDRNAARGSCGHHTPPPPYGPNRRIDNDYQHYYPKPPTRRPTTGYLPHRNQYLPHHNVNLQYNGYGHSQSYDFWGLDEGRNNYLPAERPKVPSGGSYLPPGGDGLLPPDRGGHTTAVGSYLPSGGSSSGYGRPHPPYKSPEDYPPPHKKPEDYPPPPYKPPEGYPPPYKGPEGYPPHKKPHPVYLPPGNDLDSSFLPLEPRNTIKDECSLRSATGFRLQKGIVRKFFYVPNIYECELLCFKEKDFRCSSYAYRYTIDLSTPTDNCYLSDKSYKLLDFYTDLQPDKDFDIYTMNKEDRCEQPMLHGKDNSDCFWRVRSGHRLDHQVVRDSLQVRSIVDCQIECLHAQRFTCRAFSFRYGLPSIGGSIDNCQLTDWPYYELDRKNFIPEQNYELYERGSFGHGCEPNHFGIRGKTWKAPEEDINQVCYSSYNSPSCLTPSATRKEIHVQNEADCKSECTKLRETTLFQCMSFSITIGRWDVLCKLSDIYQRDLLPHVDYQSDPDSWLFAWDNYNPTCKLNHNNRYLPTALDTWRVYTVSGVPCRRGSTCQENREAGFWFCHLDSEGSWDYCCRPDHQCGYSQHYPYQWCYVGPSNTQWRKCNDQYYPYNDRFDQHPPLYTNHHISHRPDRPSAPPTHPPPQPSLDQYEEEFETQFLDPPKPGGFGKGRHWPLQYLHKELPPNATEAESKTNPKFAAIQNLIDVIKSNDLDNLQYQIGNDSSKNDDVLLVSIPLPVNFTNEIGQNAKKGREIGNSTVKSLPKLIPLTKMGFVERTNVTRRNLEQ